MHSLEKTSSKFYTNIIDKIKNASAYADEKEKVKDGKPVMNKYKLQEIDNALELNNVEEIF
jgi:hypothetical protein